ncbi:MAG TPA: DUF2934 domain-containing protein [Ideonella sp.]|uniref:DUF2934 domain-containing protein n=1 Tax=Ideonella sp. TaxID=1929293 RepID=UPI002C009258|nr:DUF2934 domain-containing protein [Ideonella sp.]HSI51843.1 DUF2934 domain-containing protein [Ideonella sp.]
MHAEQEIAGQHDDKDWTLQPSKQPVGSAQANDAASEVHASGGGDGNEGAFPFPTQAHPPDREARIAFAAHARYEARGRAPGLALQDWLAAEAEIDAELNGEAAKRAAG